MLEESREHLVEGRIVGVVGLAHCCSNIDHKEAVWRECLFMKRLGLSEEDISKYMRKAEEAETYT